MLIISNRLYQNYFKKARGSYFATSFLKNGGYNMTDKETRGRKPITDEQLRRVNTKIRIRRDLKDKAIEQGINFSQLMEQSLLDEFRKNDRRR